MIDSVDSLLLVSLIIDHGSQGSIKMITIKNK